MNRFIFHAAFILTCSAVFLACPYAYTPSTALIPQHITKLGLRPIKNNTTFFGLEDKLTLRLQEEFTRGGQYPLVAEELAEGVIICEINRYFNDPVSYDENGIVQERRLRVLINIYFWDRVQNKILWSEPNLQGVHRYFVETRPGGISEEEARVIVWDKLSRDIYKRTVEGFGSVTGELERTVPQGEKAGRGQIK